MLLAPAWLSFVLVIPPSVFDVQWAREFLSLCTSFTHHVLDWFLHGFSIRAMDVGFAPPKKIPLVADNSCALNPHV